MWDFCDTLSSIYTKINSTVNRTINGFYRKRLKILSMSGKITTFVFDLFSGNIWLHYLFSLTFLQLFCCQNFAKFTFYRGICKFLPIKTWCIRYRVSFEIGTNLIIVMLKVFGQTGTVNYLRHSSFSSGTLFWQIWQYCIDWGNKI